MPDSETSQEGQRFGGWVTFLKNFVALLRDVTVLAIVLLLLLFPTQLNQILTNAGFEEGGIVGFKWKRSVAELSDKLRVAEEALTTLRAQNESLSKALSTAKATNEVAKAEFARLQTANRRVSEAAQQVQASVAATIENNAPLVDKAVALASRASYPDSAYCYQEDRLQDGASRYSVHCHETEQRCETARGPSKVRKQTQCELTDLTTARWNPSHPGWLGSWYQFSRQPFGKPFPQLK